MIWHNPGMAAHRAAGSNQYQAGRGNASSAAVEPPRARLLAQATEAAIEQALWHEEQAAARFMGEPTESHRRSWAQARAVVDRLAHTADNEAVASL